MPADLDGQAALTATGAGPGADGVRLTLHVPGPPRGKQRARVTRTGRAYTPQQTVASEAWVRACAVQQCGQPVLSGPLRVDLTFLVPIPRSWPKKRVAALSAGLVFPTSKPDLDNIVKLYCDALNGILWSDDAQLVDVSARKRYGEAPGAWIRVWELPSVDG